MKLVISAHTSLLSNLIKIFFACKKNISYLEPREGIRAVAGEGIRAVAGGFLFLIKIILLVFIKN
jgi:hypothetical protein